jgi:hypothetical protein
MTKNKLTMLQDKCIQHLGYLNLFGIKGFVVAVVVVVHTKSDITVPELPHDNILMVSVVKSDSVA